jgi:hypothetical protein
MGNAFPVSEITVRRGEGAMSSGEAAVRALPARYA